MQARTPLPDCLAGAAQEIAAGACTFALAQAGKTVHTGNGRGVRPILQVYDTQPALLAGAQVADKVIGKAAAMVLGLAGAAYVYGETMSESAAAWLAGMGVEYGYGRLVPGIHNRSGDGPCPLEASVAGLEDAVEGLAAIRAAITRLMQGQA